MKQTQQNAVVNLQNDYVPVKQLLGCMAGIETPQTQAEAFSVVAELFSVDAQIAEQIHPCPEHDHAAQNLVELIAELEEDPLGSELFTDHAGELKRHLEAHLEDRRQCGCVSTGNLKAAEYNAYLLRRRDAMLHRADTFLKTHPRPPVGA